MESEKQTAAEAGSASPAAASESPEEIAPALPSQIGSYRWLICALLFLATTINYVDRQILSLVKPILDKELGWTNAQFGDVNAAFQGAYAVGLLCFGWLVDRFGTKIGYGLSIGFWSVAAVCHAFVGSVAGFMGARIFLGVSESGNFPSAIKSVALWFPRKERAYATSLFNSGANVGAILAPAVVPFLVSLWNWRLPFVVAGAAGFVWLIFWRSLYQAPDRHPRVSLAELDYIRSDLEIMGIPSQAEGSSWLALLRYPQTWSFVVAKFMTDPVWWFFLIWLPGYFNETKGLDLNHLGAPLMVIYSIATVLSIAGGWLTNYLVQCGWTSNRARKTCMLLFALCVVPVLFVKGAGLWGAVGLIGLAAAAHQAWSANLFTTVSDMFPKRAVASVVGIGGMAGSIGGLMFPHYSGLLLDKFKKAGDINTGYGILFGICAGAYVVAFFLNHLLAPRFEQITLREIGK
jgi:ACS family hexuronate transporter-like MFS transporter